MFKNYLKTAFRNARKRKNFTFISLFSLILGISLFFVIGIWVLDEFSYDKSFTQRENIYRLESQLVMQDGTTTSFSTVGWPVGKNIIENYPEVEFLTYMRNWSPAIKFNETKIYENALMADNKFFDVFGYELEEGNSKDALLNPYSLVITSKLKEKFFGTENALGRILTINDSIPYKITGVLKKINGPTHLKFDALASFSTICASTPNYCESRYSSGWFANVNVYNYIRIKDNVDRLKTKIKIENFFNDKSKEASNKTEPKAKLIFRPIKDIYLKSGMPTGLGNVGNIKSVELFLSIGIFILLLACLNFINLTTASSMERAKEIGIKKILGSNRKKLIYQFLIEAGFLCVIATLISLVLVILILPNFNQFTGKDFTISDIFTLETMSLLFGIVIILIPLAGFFPAWIMSSFKPVKALKSNFSYSFSGNSFRKILVVFQFAISIIFIMSTMVIDKQMNYMQNQNLGFDKDRIIMIEASKIPSTLRTGKAVAFKNTLKNYTGITKVSASAAIPGRTGWGSQYAFPEGKEKNEALIVEYIPVDSEYIETLGLDLAEGRNFFKGSEMDSKEALIINEAAVEKFGWGNNQNAIGKKLSTSGKQGKVIGVLKNYHQHGLQNKISPLVLGVRDFIRIFAVRFENISAKDAVASVTEAWNEVYKDYPLEYNFMNEVLQKQYEKEEKLSSFFQLATYLSILIACLGLLGLSIYTAQKRIKEIGVRKVLGASVVEIVGLLSKDFMKLVFLAIVIATPIVWFAMNNWLKNFAYRIDLEWWTFVLSSLLVTSIAFITISFHSVYAALSNPTKILRAE